MDLAKIRKKSLQTAEEAAPTRTFASMAVVPLFESAMLKSFAEPRTPLEAILAGRTAAGCNAALTDADDFTSADSTESSREFLCFRVSDEFYGIDIMEIKEIIKPRDITEVPRTPAFVSGILSLRGVIIPVIDMRIRLGLVRSAQTGKERVVVVKQQNSLSGLLVDEVLQVVRIKTDTLEAVPPVIDGINRDFISGIGRSDDRLIILLHVENSTDIDLY
ncbi:MAG TPA: chemotaxis protein CheW [Desulfuromonadales bacterium]|nr:chemotaxis protein CheW [Desulfuromonadales bacterium]